MTSDRSAKAFLLTLTAGILMVCNASLLGAAALWFPTVVPTMPGTTANDPSVLLRLAAIGLSVGLVVVLAAVMLRRSPTHRKAWGAVAILFSLPSVVSGGGFIVGFILGIIGGAFALSRKA
jgi:hypothetical protein